MEVDRLNWKYWHNTIKEEFEERLNSWERDFIDSIETKIVSDWPLTPAQADKLEQIYERLTSNASKRH